MCNFLWFPKSLLYSPRLVSINHAKSCQSMHAGLLSWNHLAHTHTFGTQEVMEYIPIIYHIYVMQHMQDHSLPCFTLAGHYNHAYIREFTPHIHTNTYIDIHTHVCACACTHKQKASLRSKQTWTFCLHLMSDHTQSMETKWFAQVHTGQ